MKAKLFILLSAAIAVLFSSCTAEPKSTGSLEIVVEKTTTKGTFYPESGSSEVAVTEYWVSGTGPGNAAVARTSFGASETISLEGLIKGEWTFTVEGEANGKVVLKGSKTVYISPSSNNSCTISVSDYGKGTLAAFDVTISGEVTNGTLRITRKQYGSNEEGTLVNETAGLAGNQTVQIPVTTDIEAGKYLIRGILKNGDEEMVGGFTHIVQISNSMTTTITGTTITIEAQQQDDQTTGGVTIDDNRSKTLIGEIELYPTPDSGSGGAYGIGQNITAVYKEGATTKEENESLISEWFINEIPIDSNADSIPTDEYLDEQGNPRPAIVFSKKETGTFTLKAVVYSSLYGSMGIAEKTFTIADLEPTGSLTKSCTGNIVLKDYAFLADGSIAAVTSDGDLARYNVTSSAITQTGTPVTGKNYKFVEVDSDLGIIFAARESSNSIDAYYLNDSVLTLSATLLPANSSVITNYYGTYDKIYDMKLNSVGKYIYLAMEDTQSTSPNYKYATIEAKYVCTNNTPSISKRAAVGYLNDKTLEFPYIAASQKSSGAAAMLSSEDGVLKIVNQSFFTSENTVFRKDSPYSDEENISGLVGATAMRFDPVNGRLYVGGSSAINVLEMNSDELWERKQYCESGSETFLSRINVVKDFAFTDQFCYVLSSVNKRILVCSYSNTVPLTYVTQTEVLDYTPLRAEMSPNNKLLVVQTDTDLEVFVTK